MHFVVESLAALQYHWYIILLLVLSKGRIDSFCCFPFCTNHLLVRRLCDSAITKCQTNDLLSASPSKMFLEGAYHRGGVKHDGS